MRENMPFPLVGLNVPRAISRKVARDGFAALTPAELGEYSDRHPATTVVVLAGVGHAMKGGIPDEVTRRSGKSCRVIMPELPHLDRTRVTAKDADFLVLSGY